MKKKIDLASARRMAKARNKKTARRGLAIIKDHKKHQRLKPVRG